VGAGGSGTRAIIHAAAAAAAHVPASAPDEWARVHRAAIAEFCALVRRRVRAPTLEELATAIDTYQRAGEL
jgi:hypothetical protein